MKVSSRAFLLDAHDVLYALPHTLYGAMLRDPAGHPVARFAGMRVRCVAALIERERRKPVGILSLTYPIMQFDSSGVFDARRHIRAFVGNEEAGGAAQQSEIWTPSPSLLTRIQDCALGLQPAHRI